MPTGLSSSPSVVGVGRRERTAQAQTSTASFAISAGWTLIGPTRNQRCAPLIDGATASTATQPTNASDEQQRRERPERVVVDPGEHRQQRRGPRPRRAPA